MASTTVKNQAFDLAKQTRLAGVDLSRKGSIDEPIRSLVEHINGCSDFVTSSSCSGRVVVYCQAEGKIIKSGCKWILVSHEKVDDDALFSVLDPKKGDLVLKFEPFILHVQCRHLQHAQIMHKIAIGSGFRNSGITIGKAGKITLAIRSSLSLEVPLSYDEKLLVDKEYTNFLNKKIAQKFDENIEKIQRFYHGIVNEFHLDKNVNGSNSMEDVQVQND